MKVGDLVKIKEHYHLQLGQNPIGLVLNSSVNKKNGRQVYEVQLFEAYIDFQGISHMDYMEVFKKFE